MPDVLFTETDEGPRLIGTRCRRCGSMAFPARQGCAGCSSEDVDDELLATRGTLWTWTVQSFPPPPPFPGGAEFTPFGVGYVELPGQVRVETILTESDPERLHIGMPVKLVLVPYPGASTEAKRTYAFAPAEEGAS